MTVAPLLDLAVLAGVALVGYVVFRLTPLSRDFDWYTYRLGLSSRVGFAAWVAGVGGVYAVGQLVRTDPGPVWLLLLGVYLFGLFFLTLAVSNRPRAAALSAALAADTEGADPSGSVVVSGTAERCDGTLTTPYARREALCFHAVVTRENGVGWALLDRDTERTRFAVADRWGDTVVDPAGGRLFLDEGRTVATPLGTADDEPDAELRFPSGDRPPDPVAEALSDRAGLDDDALLDTGLRVREYTLEPGEESLAVGEAAEGTDPEGWRTKTLRAGDGRRSAVATGPLDTVAGRFERTVGRYLRLGTALVVVGLGGALLLGAVWY